jgi:hypothetical protein
LALLLGSSAKSGSAPSLAVQARWLAQHGGVRSSRYGDATPHMKQLVRALIRQTFRPAGWAAVREAECLSRREAGWNPAAVSPSDDHGAFQAHRPAHPQFDYARISVDPAYSVWVGWIISDHGTNWSPWNGGVYSCA